MTEAADTLPTLHGYFRSSASWRVRIAMALKGLQSPACVPPSPPGASRVRRTTSR